MNESVVIESYGRHKNLKIVGKEVGVSWQNVYSILRRHRVAVTGDKRRYGCEKDRFAVIAEDEFQRLVPEAVNQNAEKYQAKVDFMIHGMRVDVKSSRLNTANVKRGDAKRWAFCMSKQTGKVDFFVLFGFNEDGSYRVFLLPFEFAGKQQSISIGVARGSKWHDFEIQPDELAPFFDEVHS